MRARSLTVVVLMALAAVLTAVWPQLPATADVVAQAPDVIVVMTDDQRVGTERAMPNVSAFFSRGGVRYPNAEVPTNLCCPARSAFLTGKYAHTTGVWENSGSFGSYRAFAPNETQTLPLALSEVGYRTGLYGKYINHFNALTADDFVPPGWDEFHIPSGEDHDGGYYGPVRGLPTGYTPDTMGAGAAEFIRTTAPDQPLFLMYSPFAPHYPYDPGPYAGQLSERELLAHQRFGRFRNPAFNEEDVSDKPAWVRKTRPLRPRALTNVVRGQAQSLVAVDANFQRLMAAQAQYRDPANTIVVYLSDNGYAWGEHRLLLKRHPYSLVSGIPLWIKYPAGVTVPAGVDTRLTNQLDVTRTLAELTGAQLATEGVSLVSEPRRSRLLLEAAPSRAGIQRSPAFCGFRTERYLFVYYGSNEGELYDLPRDPFELTNIFAQRPDITLQLSLDAERAGCDVTELQKMPAPQRDTAGD